MRNKKIEKILPLVQKPARYTGGELNSVIKNLDDISVRFAFCFPDIYEIGMSHLGMKILYGLINEMDGVWCERCFAPDIDMEEFMRKESIPLFALESGDSISNFDFIGFTLQYELCYTNMLNMLDLAGIPLRSSDRKELKNIVVAGGPCVCNPEPIADFVDMFILGEGEEIQPEFIRLYDACKKKGESKNDFLKKAACIQGVYVPSFYDVEYNGDGSVKSVMPNVPTVPESVSKRVVKKLDTMYFPKSFVVPYIDVVHDRATSEIFRGCIRGCRFCQAGFIYRPIREKSIETICTQSRQLCDSTGYDELSLCSLSTSDYSGVEELLTRLISWTSQKKINLSLPSLRVDNFSDNLAERLSKVRRSGLTFAPEAGTQRLRNVINKNVTEEELKRTCIRAFKNGWTQVKLYFMIGLPTETDEDVKGIAELASKVLYWFSSLPDKPQGKSVHVSVSVSSFIPKPFTPFQWERADLMKNLSRKQKLLTENVKSKKISVSWHDPKTSFMEAVLAKGSRRLGTVIESAFRKGCKFDAWDDKFNYSAWMKAFEEQGVDPAFFANREIPFDEVLPWDHLNYSIRKEFLINENQKAHRAETSFSCHQKCSACGADKLSGGVCDARG